MSPTAILIAAIVVAILLGAVVPYFIYRGGERKKGKELIEEITYALKEEAKKKRP